MARPLVCALALASAAYGLAEQLVVQECPIFFSAAKRCDPLPPKSFLPAGAAAPLDWITPTPDLDVLVDLLDAMHVMQTAYFAPWLGTWPDAIDWTAAVTGTHVSGATRTLSEAVRWINRDRKGPVDWRLKANLVEKYFTQVTASYFGQDAFAIRNEAYDDILWVVLGWLEAIQLVNEHTDLHFSEEATGQEAENVVEFFSQTYHGNTWVPAFSHRARIFWELASKGWDTKLCGGGMIWNPRLLPYKNAITNELYIAASISMYLHFPGDDNMSPFSGEDGDAKANLPGPRDAKYLQAAVEGYKWLVSSNMTDKQGLYTDGFHISGYTDSGNNNTKCDQRDNVVLSYNQGVLLTGLRGLWDATGAPSFLWDGHRLIQNVIKASGFDLATNTTVDDLATLIPGRLPPWHGLGRAGVMEDPCDASGTCSQDGQTFKGIFFHHLTAFCARLTTPAASSGLNFDTRAFAAVAGSHGAACASYGGWLKHNARAALGTRDSHGRYGQWWTAGLLTANWTGPWPTMEDDGVPRDEASGTDYRNYGVPNSPPWRAGSPPSQEAVGSPTAQQHPMEAQTAHARADGSLMGWGELRKKREVDTEDNGADAAARDPNTRGRGRTVETQGGGLALLRAYWKIVLDPLI
ncbi:glycoside hydrolase family 76 protein [Hypoxylon sp. FL1150]|nr:glycoside hydrolase family 76 protein [Hypoxylon sp. FL1150]